MTIQKVTVEEFTQNVGDIHGKGKRATPEVAAMLQLEVGEALKITTEHKHYQIKKDGPRYIKKSTTGNTMCSMYMRLKRASIRREIKIDAKCIDGTVWVLRREDNSLVI